ncbi:MAG: hypothetical protein LBV52_01285 [Spirochaetaceae bacterium]|jgi:hypothetical protein|nr:hypothetical protein [Spirochaetaceae bacterium]
MNTGPSIFSETLPTYTVVGGKERLASTGVSAILLNRGAGVYSRKTCIASLQEQGFDYIISVENFGEHYELEQLSELFPFVSFILFKENVSIGQMINIAAGEITSPVFFVLWNDLHLLQGLSNTRIIEKLLVNSVVPGKNTGSIKDPAKDWYMRLCTIPVIQNAAFETLPTSVRAQIRHKKLETTPVIPSKEGESTLFTFDAVGIYNKEKFLNLGGFDPSIKSSYWQFMDFGLRAWLWGEELRSTQLVRLRLDGEFTAGDTTIDESYWWLFLKNLAPRIKPVTHIPWNYFFQYLFKTGKGITRSYREFSAARKWVKLNGKSFKYDAASIEQLL